MKSTKLKKAIKYLTMLLSLQCVGTEGDRIIVTCPYTGSGFAMEVDADDCLLRTIKTECEKRGMKICSVKYKGQFLKVNETLNNLNENEENEDSRTFSAYAPTKIKLVLKNIDNGTVRERFIGTAEDDVFFNIMANNSWVGVRHRQNYFTIKSSERVSWNLNYIRNLGLHPMDEIYYGQQAGNIAVINPDTDRIEFYDFDPEETVSYFLESNDFPLDATLFYKGRSLVNSFRFAHFGVQFGDILIVRYPKTQEPPNNRTKSNRLPSILKSNYVPQKVLNCKGIMDRFFEISPQDPLHVIHLMPVHE